jgi:hypothetical protein
MSAAERFEEARRARRWLAETTPRPGATRVVRFLALAAGLVVAALGPRGASATELTGIVQLTGDANGRIWNTLSDPASPDPPWHLYLVPGPVSAVDPSAPAFLNHGDGPSTRIEQALAPGSYTYSFFAEPFYGTLLFANGSYVYGRFEGVPDQLILNLFFNGDDASPRIAGVAASAVTIGGATGAVTALSAADADYALDYGFAFSPGTLVYDDGVNTVTLTQFFAWYPSAYQWDLVSARNDQPSNTSIPAADYPISPFDFSPTDTFAGQGLTPPFPSGLSNWPESAFQLYDYVSQFTLVVTPDTAGGIPVPEPTPPGLALAALLALRRRALRPRARPAPARS